MEKERLMQSLRTAAYALGRKRQELATFIAQAKDESTRTHWQGELDREISTHALNIASLKRGFNQEHVRIMRLPPEIFVEIFAYFVANAVESVKNSPHAREYRQAPLPTVWIRIAHICHHWREVARASPSLWGSIIVPRNLPTMHELLALAKAGPFDIRAGPNSSVQALRLALAFPERLRSLELVAITFSDNVDFPARMPLLQSLTIDQGRDWDTHSYTTRLLTPLGQYQMPSLQRLCLLNFQRTPSWNSPFFRPTLRVLTISYNFSDFVINPGTSLIDMCYMLQRTPLLEVLRINSIPAFSALRLKVVLPNMTHLSIAGGVSACAELLQVLSLPCLEALVVDCYGDADHRGLAELCGSIGRHLTNTLGMPSTALITNFMSPGGHHSRTKLTCWGSLYHVDDIVRSRHKSLSAPSLEFTYDASPFSDLVSSISIYLPLSTLQSLWLVPIASTDEAMCTYITGTEWIETLRHLPNLWQLCVPWDIESLFLDALSMREATSVTDDSEDTSEPQALHLMVPKLQVLRLSGTMDAAQESSGVAVQRYIEILQLRKNAGMGLRRLAFERCDNISKQQIQMFKGVVEDLDLDADNQKLPWASQRVRERHGKWRQ